jgi:hypothetical protein
MVKLIKDLLKNYPRLSKLQRSKRWLTTNCELQTAIDMGVPLIPMNRERGGLSRAALRSGTDEGSVLNPYNP